MSITDSSNKVVNGSLSARQLLAHNGPVKSVIHAACPHDCPDACAVLITVEDGRATKIQGDPNHPVTRGFLCAKVAKYLDRVYSPQRVLYPMKRMAPKGSGTHAIDDFVRISWDEALDTVADRLKQIAAESGPEAILPYSYGGTLGALNAASMDRRFFHRLGASQLNRTICSAAGGDALISVIGKKMGTEPEQFRESRLIIAWGANIHGNNVHLWPFIEEARRKGGKLVVIDPYRTRTAKCANWYLPINPGTDVALALGMMHIVIGEGLYDRDYVAQHTIGFDALRERVKEYTPERVAQWTGISADDIRRLAHEYATVRPAVIRVNYGLQRCENGGMAVRAIAMLPCITGSWKEVGGGLQLSTGGAFGLNKPALEMPELMTTALGRPARVVNMSQLGAALNELSAPPVKALFVYNSNPAAVAPDHNKVVKGLKRADLFTVVHEQFLTDTCDYADIVLPATTFFEHKDLQTAYGHYYVQISNAAIAPMGEAKSNVELFRSLAERMGFAESCFRQSEDSMIEQALDSGAAVLEGISRERLEREYWVRLNVGKPGSSGNSSEFRVPSSAAEVPQGLKPGSVLDLSRRAEALLYRNADAAALLEPNAEAAGVLDPNAERGAEARDTESRTPFLPFANGAFATPSGKAELYSEALAAQGLDPIASFVAPRESRHVSGKFPLEMLARKADNYVNSTFANLPPHQAMEEMDMLEISRADAECRDIVNGDRVRVFNARGSLELTARVDGAVQRGVVAAKLGWAKLSSNGQNVNVLTSERLTDIGAGPTFYSCMVEVEKAAISSQRSAITSSQLLVDG
jgi:anaerobic selenocysteine-containing dehydrogenase